MSYTHTTTPRHRSRISFSGATPFTDTTRQHALFFTRDHVEKILHVLPVRVTPKGILHPLNMFAKKITSLYWQRKSSHEDMPLLRPPKTGMFIFFCLDTHPSCQHTGRVLTRAISFSQTHLRKRMPNNNRLSPIKAIRKTCLLCQGGSRKLVAECPEETCPLHPYRFGTIPQGSVTPLPKIIRKFCLRCAGSASEANACKGGTPVATMAPCYLHPYRKGRMPIQKKQKRKPRRLKSPSGAKGETELFLPL